MIRFDHLSRHDEADRLNEALRAVHFVESCNLALSDVHASFGHHGETSLWLPALVFGEIVEVRWLGDQFIVPYIPVALKGLLYTTVIYSTPGQVLC